MNLQLNGKTALVTGSTAGIAFAIAQALAVNGRSDKRLDIAVKKIQDSGTRGEVQGITADLGTVDGVRRAIDGSLQSTFSSTTWGFTNRSRSSELLTPTGCVFSR